MQKLSKKDEISLTYRFNKIRKTKEGLKINVDKLDNVDIANLATIVSTNNIIIKRSGIGMVIIIE